MKKPIKDKHVRVQGVIAGLRVIKREFDCLITNDENRKTLSISDGMVQFTIPFEPIERYLK